jgi:hypothetical protein
MAPNLVPLVIPQQQRTRDIHGQLMNLGGPGTVPLYAPWWHRAIAPFRLPLVLFQSRRQHHSSIRTRSVGDMKTSVSMIKIPWTSSSSSSSSSSSYISAVRNISVYSRTIASTSTATKASSDTNDTSKSSNNSNSKANNSNIFLDNLGTIFLLLIGSVIASLVRSYYNGVRRNAVREEQIESLSLADPIELDDLRSANSEFSSQIFQQVQNYIMNQQRSISHRPNNRDHTDGNSDLAVPSEVSAVGQLLTYPEFVLLVRTAMVQMKGETFTIQFGHVMDRIVVAALEKQQQKKRPQNSNVPATATDDLGHEKDALGSTNIMDATPMPLEFWLTVLSLVMYSTPEERIQALHGIFCKFHNETTESPRGTMTMDQVVQLVGYLQDTCQLVSDAQIVTTANKYPLQEYVIGTPEQLVDRQQWDAHNSKDSETNTNEKSKLPTVCENITPEMLTEILSSKSICAWGECYRYKPK